METVDPVTKSPGVSISNDVFGDQHLIGLEGLYSNLSPHMIAPEDVNGVFTSTFALDWMNSSPQPQFTFPSSAWSSPDLMLYFGACHNISGSPTTWRVYIW